MSNPLNVEIKNGTMIVRFVRPEIRNPLSANVLAELEKVIDGLAEDDSIDEVVITGTGGVFASGADIREIAKLTGESASDFARRGQRLMNKIADLKQTTIASVNGFCYGGALDLALSCERRIASTNASFCHPGAGLGIITGWGGTQRLPRLIGTANASMMFFTAEPIGAEEAFRIGLVDVIENDLAKLKKGPKLPGPKKRYQ